MMAETNNTSVNQDVGTNIVPHVGHRGQEWTKFKQQVGYRGYEQKYWVTFGSNFLPFMYMQGFVPGELNIFADDA